MSTAAVSALVSLAVLFTVLSYCCYRFVIIIIIIITYRVTYRVWLPLAKQHLVQCLIHFLLVLVGLARLDVFKEVHLTGTSSLKSVLERVY